MGEMADTGRIMLFNAYFKNWDLGHALMGDFAQYGSSNMHNSFLTLMAMFGIPAAVYYMYFLYKSTTVYSERLETPVTYAGYVGWVMMIIHGIAEGTMVSAGTVYAGMMGLLLVLMLPEGNTE